MQKDQKAQKELERSLPAALQRSAQNNPKVEARMRVALQTVEYLRELGPVTFDRERQDVFLAGIMAGLTVPQSAMVAGVSPRTPYSHMRANPEFRERFEDAQVVRASLAEERLMEWSEIDDPEKAPTMAQVRAVEIWLKGNHPDHRPDRLRRGDAAASAQLRRLPDGSMSLTVQGGDFMRQ